MIKQKIKAPKQKEGTSSEEEGLFAEESQFSKDFWKAEQETAEPFPTENEFIERNEN